MSAIQIVREQNIGFDAQGQTVVTDEYFIKLKVAFRRFARQFKGAKLYFFLEVAFQEADIHLRGAQPLTIPEVSTLWDVSRRSVVDAVEYLVSHNFIVKVGVRGPDDPHRGAYMYRPSAFAWFGAGLEPPTDSGALTTAAPNDTLPMQNLHTSPLVQNAADGMQNPTGPMQPTAHQVCKKPRGGVQNPAGGVQNAVNHIVDDIGTNLKGTNKKQQERKTKTSKTVDLDAAAQNARAQFRSFGIGGINLGKLVRLVSPEIAEEWALYARHTDKPREIVQGICYNSLILDPTAPPPCSPRDLEEWRLDETRIAERLAAQAEYERQVAAGEIAIAVDQETPIRTRIDSAPPVNPADSEAVRLWTAALLELQLQMTKATFDTWVKPTFALQYDAERAQIVIGVRNAYAKQWLENRLREMILRTLNHVAGKPVEVEFLLKTREESGEDLA